MRTQIFPRGIGSLYQECTHFLPGLPLIRLILHNLLALLTLLIHHHIPLNLLHQISAATLAVDKPSYARPITTGS